MKKFLNDFLDYLHIFRHLPVVLRIKTAWHSASVTI